MSLGSETGRSGAGRPHPYFLDLDPEHRDPERAAACILPVPYDATSCWVRGADRGPAALISASNYVELYDIETASEPYRRGIATLAAVEFEGPPEGLAEVVADRVGEILGLEQLPVVLGGEHSVTLGPVRAAAARIPGLSVLQIDAHGDTRESYGGSPFNHACVMARVRELCPIVQVGIRSLDASEVEGMDASRVVLAHEIAAERGGWSAERDRPFGTRSDRGPSTAGLTATRPAAGTEAPAGSWVRRAVSLLTDEVYVTIDVDAFDPSVMPATGTPEPGGLYWYEVNALLAEVARSRRVVGFDVVELLDLPGEHASAFTAAKLVYRFLAEIFAAAT